MWWAVTSQFIINSHEFTAHGKLQDVILLVYLREAVLCHFKRTDSDSKGHIILSTLERLIQRAKAKSPSITATFINQCL